MQPSDSKTCDRRFQKTFNQYHLNKDRVFHSDVVFVNVNFKTFVFETDKWFLMIAKLVLGLNLSAVNES